MGYLSKELILKSYQTLSSLTEDHKQGQTQIVSAIRHLFALDMFYKSKAKDCDLNSNDDKSIFIENVKKLVNIKEYYYTTNFYTTIKPLEDCGVGSNFTSAGVVNNSKQNTIQTYDYPTRGQYPLFNVRNAVAIRNVGLYRNIKHYLCSETIRAAFAIWILRNEHFLELDLIAIKGKLQSILTQELIEAFMPKDESIISFIEGYPLSDQKYQTETSDMLNLFQSSKNKISENRNYYHYLAALRTKPFMLLAGISGTGKSRIVREFAFKSCPKYLQDKAGTTPGNYCMIEVKPNWHDSTELLGYYSRLGNKPGYQFTKFVKFLVKAKMFPTVPFFVCLDEMNLAPVEQYFAEILSILETRKHPKNGETGEVDMTMVKTEPIIEAQYFRELSEMPDIKNKETGALFNNELTDKDFYLKLFGIDSESDIDEEVGSRTDLTSEGLTLPDNVIIIGTVNMDDTTHQFSRKVIDRAMTIEMNGGDLRSMFGGSRNLEYLPEDEQNKWQNAFTRQYVTADEVLEAHSDVAEELMDKLPSRLEQINLALKGTPFEVSYRVLNELTIMVGVMLDDGMELGDAISQSVNNILLMKILPRIEGDAEMFTLSREYKNKVGVSYDNRLEWLKDIAPDIKEPLNDAESEEEDTEEKAKTVKEHQQTAKEKIQDMIDRLNNQEFTRFWP